MAGRKISKTDKTETVEKVTPAPSRMSAAHKKALATGREEGRAVRRYLEALESARTVRGKRRNTESIAMRLSQIDAHLSRADPVSRVMMIQERMNLEHELDTPDPAADLAALEAAFVEAAGPYSLRRKVSWTAWREAGVPAGVLRQAGIRRGAAT